MRKFALALALLGALLASAHLWAPPCQVPYEVAVIGLYTARPCFWSKNYVASLGALLTLSAFLALLSPTSLRQVAAFALVVALAVPVSLLLGNGLCSEPGAACRTRYLPALAALSVVIVAVSLAAIVKRPPSRKPELRERDVAKLVFGVGNVLLGALVALLPFTLTPICPFAYGWPGYHEPYWEPEPGIVVPANCLVSASQNVAFGLLLITAGALTLTARALGAKRVMLTIAAALGILTSASFTLIGGTCVSPEYPCVYATTPALTLLGFVVLVFNIVGAVLQREAGAE